MNRRRLPEWLQNDNSNSPEKITQHKRYKNEENIEDLLSSEIEIFEKISISYETTKSEKSIEDISSSSRSEGIQPEKLIANITLSEPNQSGRVLRSQSNKNIAKEPEIKPSQYPFIEYKGNIKYLIDMIDIACTCDEIMKWVELQQKDIVPIAFDMEWPFSFNTGPGKTALIQICAEENICFLFHVFNLKKLPAALVSLLGHKKVQLHGVNIKNDLRKLQRDFPEVNVQHMVEQCLDLGTWCNIVCNTGGRWSLERLVLYICKLRINKDKKVRMSKWHVIPLNESQKMYAAIDVYISQVIYKELEKRRLEKEKRTEEFLETFGKETLAAVTILGENFV